MSQVNNYNATNSVQVLFDVKTFNAKLGLIKDASNVEIISTTFDVSTNAFAYDSLTISATEFVAGMSLENVVSVGKYATLYSDFDTYVQSYFGQNGGFSTLFHRYQPNNSVFDAAAFMNFITGDASNNFSVSITVSNINKLLSFAVDSNCFGNRIDPSGVNYGFIANDLIWVPKGTTIQLNLNIDAESFTPVNNRGPIYAADIGISQDTSFTTGDFVETTHSTTTNISRTLEAPLLIRLI